jgi:hypothetical protein
MHILFSIALNMNCKYFLINLSRMYVLQVLHWRNKQPYTRDEKKNKPIGNVEFKLVFLHIW